VNVTQQSAVARFAGFPLRLTTNLGFRSAPQALVWRLLCRLPQFLLLLFLLAPVAFAHSPKPVQQVNKVQTEKTVKKVQTVQNEVLVKRLEVAATLIRDNRLVDAERELAPVLKAVPDAPVVLNLMGTLRAKQARLDEAESLFVRAIRSDRRFVGARMNLVYLYLLKRMPEKSILELKEVVNIEPDNIDATAKLAELLLTQGRAEEAIAVIEKSKLSQTVSPVLLVLQGNAYAMKGEPAKAEASFLQALEGRLDNAEALLGLALLSQAKGEAREAKIFLSRVATLVTDSSSTDFLYRFATAALKSDMSNEAKTALERAVKLKPDEPRYMLALGVAWLRKSDLFEAEKAFRRVLELQPDSTQGQLHLGYVLLNQKRYAEARTWLEKSAQGVGSVPEVFYYLGLVAQEQNDDAAAIPLFERAIKLLPTYPHARIALGASFMKLRNYPRAQQELEAAVKLDPDEPKAHYNLALLYARLKDPQRAEAEMRLVESLKLKRAVPTDSGVVNLPPPAPR
jgi:Tfp pilus assembly protein PilF